jgi:iron complex outermembrane receptor protein
MRIKRFLIYVFCILFECISLHGQKQILVYDSLAGSVVRDVHVELNGEYVDVSDDGGYFYINDSLLNRTLRLTHLGYRTKNVKINKADTLIFLKPIRHSIEDVQVTVYQIPSKIKRLPGSFSFLQAKQVKNNLNTVPADYFNYLPGVYVHQGAYNTNRLIIRGVGSRNPYGTNRIKAYYGDIPLTTGEGISTFEDIDLIAMGSVEVLKGPASALYGSGLGGVLKLNPQKPYMSEKNVTLTTRVGEHGLMKNSASVDFKLKNSTSRLSLVRFHSNGYRENSAYDRYGFYFISNYEKKHSEVNLLINYRDMKAFIPSSLDEETFKNAPYKAAQSWDDVNGYEDYNKLSFGISHTLAYKNMSNKLSLYGHALKSYEVRPFNILDETGGTFGARNLFSVEGDKISAYFVAEYFQEQIDYSIFEIVQGNEGERQNDNLEVRNLMNVAALFKYKPFRRFRIDGGINVNQSYYALTDNFTGDSLDFSNSKTFEPVISPRIGLNYELRESLFLYASVGHGFSIPSVEQTLITDRNYNPDLGPEKGYTFDMGLRKSFLGGLIFIDINGYYMILNDLIITKRIDEELFKGINAGRTDHRGIESLLSVNYYPSMFSILSLEGQITYNYSNYIFKDFSDEGIDYSGNKLPGVPVHKGSIQLRVNSDSGINFSGAFIYVGDQELTDNNELSYPGYVKGDAKIGYSLKDLIKSRLDLEIYFGVHNILNKKYASMLLINAPSFGNSAPRYYYSGSPRNFFGGIEIRF